MCARWERDLALARLSDASYYNLLQAGYPRSTFNTQTVVVVINALNVHLGYEKRFRGPRQ